MVDFPIFEEIKNFIYVNIEYLLLIIAPICTLILFLANKINQRIENEQQDNADARQALIKKQDALEQKLNDFETKFNEFELDIRLQLQAIQLSLNIPNNQSIDNIKKRIRTKSKKNIDSEN